MGFASEPNWKANGNIAPASFVKIDTSVDDRVIQATSAAFIIGIAQEGQLGAPGISGSDTTIAAKAGDEIKVFTSGDVCLVKDSGSGFTRGDFLSAANGGLAQTAVSGQFIGAVALQTAAANAKARCKVLCTGAKA